jgi:hypothetical protein
MRICVARPVRISAGGQAVSRASRLGPSRSGTSLQTVPRGPQPGRGQGAHRCRPAAPGQLDSHKGAQGISGEMRSIEAMLVEVTLRGVDDIAHRDRSALHRGSTRMSQCVRRMHLVMVGQQWNDIAPRTFARHRETVQQHQGRLTGRHSCSLAQRRRPESHLCETSSTRPPSTTNSAAVAYDDSSLARNRTNDDTSWGSPARPNGMLSASCGSLAVIAVRMNPG